MVKEVTQGKVKNEKDSSDFLTISRNENKLLQGVSTNSNIVKDPKGSGLALRIRKNDDLNNSSESNGQVFKEVRTSKISI